VAVLLILPLVIIYGISLLVANLLGLNSWAVFAVLLLTGVVAWYKYQQRSNRQHLFWQAKLKKHSVVRTLHLTSNGGQYTRKEIEDILDFLEGHEWQICFTGFADQIQTQNLTSYCRQVDKELWVTGKKIPRDKLTDIWIKGSDDEAFQIFVQPAQSAPVDVEQFFRESKVLANGWFMPGQVLTVANYPADLILLTLRSGWGTFAAHKRNTIFPVDAFASLLIRHHGWKIEDIDRPPIS
jgi:hypothetical protein